MDASCRPRPHARRGSRRAPGVAPTASLRPCAHRLRRWSPVLHLKRSPAVHAFGWRTHAACGAPATVSPRTSEREHYAGEPEHHSAFAPENLITLAHFSVSATMSVDSSRGDIGSGTLLKSAIRVRSRGSARAVLMSPESLSTISAGVLAGAPRPNQELTS